MSAGTGDTERDELSQEAEGRAERRSNLHFTITAESSRAHWLIFIVNKQTDT